MSIIDNKHEYFKSEKYDPITNYQNKNKNGKLKNKYKKLYKKNIKKKNKIAITRHYKNSILILVILTGIFAFFVSLHFYSFLYGSIPWLEEKTWSSISTQKEYSLSKMIKTSKSMDSINKINLLSPFFNGTLSKTKIEKYGGPTYEGYDKDGNCKHTMSYDITIPPGGWIIYSSCQKSLENPQGYSSIRAIGYPAYGNNINMITPLEIDEWYHGYYTHIQVPIIVLDE